MVLWPWQVKARLGTPLSSDGEKMAREQGVPVFQAFEALAPPLRNLDMARLQLQARESC